MTDPTTASSAVLRTKELTGRECYELLTSLVVPRPIGWVSTRSREGIRNLAPFSYFVALAHAPMLVGLSVGERRGGGAKDSLRNIRQTGAFCVNVVTTALLEAMNRSSGAHAPEVDEFEVAGLDSAEAETVDAPYVASCPAVLECRLQREVDLSPAPNVFLVGEVKAVRVSAALAWMPGSRHLDTRSLEPVGRLWGSAYMLPGEIRLLDRPKADD